MAAVSVRVLETKNEHCNLDSLPLRIGFARSLDATDLLRKVVRSFANLDDSSETERCTALISATVINKIDLRGWTPSAEEVVV